MKQILFTFIIVTCVGFSCCSFPGMTAEQNKQRTDCQNALDQSFVAIAKRDSIIVVKSDSIAILKKQLGVK
jgi:hypothetical protein